jgi:hypothetical protein
METNKRDTSLPCDKYMGAISKMPFIKRGHHLKYCIFSLSLSLILYVWFYFFKYPHDLSIRGRDGQIIHLLHIEPNQTVIYRLLTLPTNFGSVLSIKFCFESRFGNRTELPFIPTNYPN